MTPITSTDADAQPFPNGFEPPITFWTNIKKQTLVNGTYGDKCAIPNAATVAGFSQTLNADFRAMRSDDTVRIWNSASGEMQFEWRIGTGFVNSASFSRDGKYIVAGCADQTARVWALQSHQIVAVLRGHDQWVNYAEFSPDGSLIVTASGDKTVRIWEIDTRQTLIQFPAYQNTVMGASFSPDGKRLATASTDGSVQLFACEVCGVTGEHLLRLAERRIRRGLTNEELERFLRVNL